MATWGHSAHLKADRLSEGCPDTADTPTTYIVYIGLKQWNKVTEAIQNHKDVLIIKGQAALDPEIPEMAVFATNVNTKLLQQGSKAKQAEIPTAEPKV